MEEKAPESQGTQGLVGKFITILVVPCHGGTRMSGMDTDLMGPARDEASLDQVQATKAPQASKKGSRWFALGGIDANYPLPATQGVFVQRGVHTQLRPGQRPGQQGQITLFDAMLTE